MDKEGGGKREKGEEEAAGRRRKEEEEEEEDTRRRFGWGSLEANDFSSCPHSPSSILLQILLWDLLS